MLPRSRFIRPTRSAERIKAQTGLKEITMGATDERKTKVADEMESEMEARDDNRVQDERAEREDVNQGMETGTHDSIHRGVKWGPAYRLRRKTAKPSEEPKT